MCYACMEEWVKLAALSDARRDRTRTKISSFSLYPWLISGTAKSCGLGDEANGYPKYKGKDMAIQNTKERLGAFVTRSSVFCSLRVR